MDPVEPQDWCRLYKGKAAAMASNSTSTPTPTRTYTPTSTPIREFFTAAFKGNAQTLRDYWSSGAAGRIQWGTPGDFDRCLQLVSKYLSDAHGYCQERHIQATGKPAGKAAGEARPSKHAALPATSTTSTALPSSLLSHQLELRARIYDTLSHSYPPNAIEWVRHINWSYLPQVPLSQLLSSPSPSTPPSPLPSPQSNNRPHAPTQDDRTYSIAAQMQRDPLSIDPLILVSTPQRSRPRYAIADGYHRVAAARILSIRSLPAYVATPPPGTTIGPWSYEMHKLKQTNRIPQP